MMVERAVAEIAKRFRFRSAAAPKQRFEGSACVKSLGPDRRKVNSPRAQVKGDCLLQLESAISVATSSVSKRGDYFCGNERNRSFGRKRIGLTLAITQLQPSKRHPSGLSNRQTRKHH